METEERVGDREGRGRKMGGEGKGGVGARGKGREGERVGLI